ncbi:nuclear transport factor 2 family protein [Actinomycetospora termitidis]|uniref:Nuclear transport factor 2 family protein n=1 Tax=Actinomycetospora termitidis TaxID=3053470 RepID=A0ABT7M488_9PSEU|nr:nuclear transport factor 2 family protein [Actinomycetospora sp. Odt1-22]MDL5155039.1 nuclear transport factor 2 family protein [Actinomycetospora sp. Odt1-22]
MASIEDLMWTNLLEVFGERDPDRRAAAIARTYASDVVFADPEESLTGHEALRAKAQSLLDQAPGFVFAADGAVHVVDDLGHLSWTFGPDGGEPVVRGTDIALVRDGVIARLYTFLR